MNLSREQHHKICGMRNSLGEAASNPKMAPLGADQRGYALVALLAVMTLLALFALAAAPSIRQQTQREREKEAIFRGEQIAEAIREYYINRSLTLGAGGDQGLPTSMDQLLEGIAVPGGSKKRQILRASAARDPLTRTGEWRRVAPRAPELMEFQRSILQYTGNVLPRSPYPQIVQLQQFAAPQLTSVLATGDSSTTESTTTTGSDSTGPFVGVVSSNNSKSVLFYYGIDRHDRWIFTPLFR